MHRASQSPACPACRAPLPELAGVPTTELDQIARMLADQQKIMAIKRVRELTRCGLKEAKDYVECPHAVPYCMACAPDSTTGSAQAATPATTDPACPVCHERFPLLAGMDPDRYGEMAREAARGNKINAIKIAREITGCGLREAKDFIECPHAIPEGMGPATDDAARCPYCSKGLAPLPNDARGEVRARVATALLQGRSTEAVKLVGEHTGWSLPDARTYVFCPHHG